MTAHAELEALVAIDRAINHLRKMGWPHVMDLEEARSFLAAKTGNLRVKLSDVTGAAHGYMQELAATKAELATLRVEAVGWSAEDACEHFIAVEVDAAPEALRRLGDWLNNVLDEDEAKTASRMVLGAMLETSAAIRAVAEAHPPQAQVVPVEVDEAMVKRALHAFTNFQPVYSDDSHAMMRAALAAALTKEST